MNSIDDKRHAIRPEYGQYVPGAVLCLFLVAFVAAGSEVRLTLEELKGLAYEGIYDRPVVLVDGLYEGPPFVAGGASHPRVQLNEDSYVVGDLDADGDDDAAVLLVENSGGSGVNVYLAVVSRRQEVLKNIATIRVGDRVRVRSVRFDAGYVVLDLIAAGPGDPMCCPATRFIMRYRLEAGSLVLTDADTLGGTSVESAEPSAGP